MAALVTLPFDNGVGAGEGDGSVCHTVDFLALVVVYELRFELDGYLISDGSTFGQLYHFQEYFDAVFAANRVICRSQVLIEFIVALLLNYVHGLLIQFLYRGRHLWGVRELMGVLETLTPMTKIARHYKDCLLVKKER